jgi:hypothetical protein
MSIETMLEKPGGSQHLNMKKSSNESQMPYIAENAVFNALRYAETF